MNVVGRASEAVVDYRAYDFRGVWRGRERVDWFDRAILESALAYADRRRILELGTGFGRLSPLLLEAAHEYVGSDFDTHGLGEALRGSESVPDGASRRAWVAANAYHLPFADSSFSTVVMIRVHHHLGTPERALKEIARVLVPGGTAVVSYNANGWIRSLVHDVGRALGRPKQANDRPILFAREGHTLVRDRPLLHYTTTSAEFAGEARQAGLREIAAFGTPETAASKLLPRGLGSTLGRRWPSSPLFSSRWSVLHRPGGPAAVAPWDSILACPRCRDGRPGSPDTAGAPFRCPVCAFEFQNLEGVPDARYVPAPDS